MSQDEYTKYLHISTMIDTVYLVVTVPLYCYGALKLSHFSKHILVQKRFPAISYAIITLSFLNNIYHCAMQWVHYISRDYILPKITVALSLFIYGLINLRLYLIYLRWKENNKSLDSLHDYKRMYSHWCSISIWLFSICASLYTIATGHHHDVVSLCVFWLTQILLSMLLITILVLNKVKEGIGCTKETIISLVIVIIPGFSSVIPTNTYFAGALRICVINLFVYVIGLVPLYFPLYYIHKMENTLKAQNVAKSRTINCDDPFFVFIENKENHDIFADYLSYCWAVENLLFYQKASVLYNIVRAYKVLCESSEDKATFTSISTDDSNSTMSTVSVSTVTHRNKFDYLTELYAYYQSQIGDEIEADFFVLRTALFKLHQSIYSEFIRDGSVNQINISFETRLEIDVLLMNDEMMDSFQSFDDFLTVFDGAMMEVYRLIWAMYLVRFKQYVASNVK